MDILSHGLWAAAGAKAVGSPLSPAVAGPRSNNKKLNIYWAFFWGMFPDLFAFTVPFALLIGSIIFGPMEFGDWPRPERGEPPSANHWPGVQIASTLYQYSHSLVIFTIVAIVVLFYCSRAGKRIPLEMLGWPLHILMDIPTHTYRFFSTPVFWPISQWRFDGFSWTHSVFMAVNYGLLVVVFIALRWKQRTQP